MAKILIVDDDANFRETVQALLAEDGHEAAIAENGQVAIQTFNNIAPDVVILDMMMPKMSGFECAAALRETPLGEKVPIIFVSGIYKNPKTAAEASDRFHAVEYLLKPFDQDVLMMALAKALGESATAAPELPATPLPEAGRLVEHSVAALLLRVAQEKHSGVLDLFAEPYRARLFFARGQLAMAQSRNPQLNIGMALLRDGQMSAIDYKALLEHIDSSGQGMYQAIKDLKAAPDAAVKNAYKKLVPRIAADCVAMTGSFRYLETDAFMRLIPTVNAPVLPAVYAGVLEAPNALLEAHLEPRKHLRASKGEHWDSGKKHLGEGLRRNEVLRAINGRARLGQIYGSATTPQQKHGRMSQLFMLVAADALTLSEEVREMEPSLVVEAPVELGRAPEVEVDESRFRPPTSAPVTPAAASPELVVDEALDAQLDEGIEFSAEEEASRAKIVAKFAELRGQDHYQVLGLERASFNPAAAKKAYFALAREFHTDSYSGQHLGSAQAKLEAVFAKIAEAYDVLGNEAKRDEYNAQLDLAAGGAQTDVGAIFEAESLLDKAMIVGERGDFVAAARYLDEAIAKYRSPMIEVWHLYCSWRAQGNQAATLPATIQRIEAILKEAKVERAWEFCGVMCRMVEDLPRARKYLLKACNEDETPSPAVERELRLIEKRLAEGNKKPAGGIGKLFSK